MKKSIIIVLFATVFALSATAQDTQKKVYNEDLDPMEQLDAALAQAKADGKFVIVQLGGNWCVWCLRFADFITTDEEVSQLVDENFVYIHVNYHPSKSKAAGKAEQTAELLRRIGNPVRFGFPVMVVLDEAGNVLHLQDSSYLEEGKGYDKKKVLSFFRNWTPKAVKGE